jgi:serine/threonine protein phosphatase PrpC
MATPVVVAPVVPAIEYAALSTSASARPHNEDRWQVAPDAGLFAIADGLSSYNAGEVAAELAVQTACQLLPDLIAHRLEPSEALRRAFAACNDEIREFAVANPECLGMATTLVCALIAGNRLYLAHVGDSRAYLLRAGRLQRLTRDHSIGQEIVEAGRMTEGQVTELPARGILTRAVGLAESIEPEISACPWGPDDTLLMCSDGITTALTDPVIEHLIIEACGRGPAAQVRALIGGALQTGGLANVTALVATPCLQRPKGRPGHPGRGGSDADRTH